MVAVPTLCAVSRAQGPRARPARGSALSLVGTGSAQGGGFDIGPDDLAGQDGGTGVGCKGGLGPPMKIALYERADLAAKGLEFAKEYGAKLRKDKAEVTKTEE